MQSARGFCFTSFLLFSDDVAGFISWYRCHRVHLSTNPLIDIKRESVIQSPVNVPHSIFYFSKVVCTLGKRSLPLSRRRLISKYVEKTSSTASTSSLDQHEDSISNKFISHIHCNLFYHPNRTEDILELIVILSLKGTEKEEEEAAE